MRIEKGRRLDDRREERRREKEEEEERRRRDDHLLISHKKRARKVLKVREKRRQMEGSKHGIQMRRMKKGKGREETMWIRE